LKYPEFTGTSCYVDSNLIMERINDDIQDLLVRWLAASLTWLENDNKRTECKLEEKQWRAENEALDEAELDFNWEFTEKWV